METRKITIVSTKDQTKKVIMSSATTLAELKADLRANGIDYEGMTFFEGTSKVELKKDASVLPHDVPWKGTTTNELVFMLTNTNKKIRSGAMSRMEAYAEIKNMGLQDACLKKFGKNYTMCKTADLIALIKNAKDKAPVQHNDCVDVKARAAIVHLVNFLEDQEVLNEYEAGEIHKTLGLDACVDYPIGDDEEEDEECDGTRIDCPYSKREIDSMFEDMDI